MTPITQTILGTPVNGRTCHEMWAEDPEWLPGNCLQAAVASLMDLPLNEVPHFVADRRPGPSPWLAMRTFARQHGVDFGWCPVTPEYADTLAALRSEARDAENEFRYCLAAGESPRGTRHVVVWDLADDDLAHDPHPSGAGLVTRDRIEWLTPPYDPDPETQYAEALADE